jgi:hypothetical protein
MPNSVTDPMGSTKYTNYAAASTNTVLSFGSSLNNNTLTADAYGVPISAQTQQAPSRSLLKISFTQRVDHC